MILLLILSLSISKATDPYGTDVSGDREIIVSGNKMDISVQVTENGRPMSGKRVRFIAHQGSLSSTSVITDESGYARSEFTALEDGWVEARVNGRTLEIRPKVLPRGGLVKLLLSVITGTILILLGLDNTNKGFSRFSGEKAREILWKMTGRPVYAYVTGIFLAIFLESSTLSGLMLLSLLESSLIKLSTALIVISGAALGSTFTVQIIATDIIKYSPILILIGYVMWQFKGRWSYIGRIIFGFGLIFFSIWLIRENITFLKDIFSIQLNPFVLFIGSVLLTFMFHSSAATLGLVIGFVSIFSFTSVIAVVLGANIGTTLTVLMGSVRSSSPDGRAMGTGYLILKVFFVLFSLYLFGLSTGFHPSSRDVANIHTIVNMWGLVFIPLCYPLAKFLKKIYRGESEKIKLDDKYLSSPSIAVARCHELIRESLDKVGEMFKKTIFAFENNDFTLLKKIRTMDNLIDKRQEALTSYTSKIMGRELSGRESKKCVTILKIMNEIENIGDIISKELMSHCEKKIKESYFFSEQGFNEIQEYHSYIFDNIEEIKAAVNTMDVDIAREILERREKSQETIKKFRESHIERIGRGKQATIDTSTIHLDLLDEFERIDIHIYNIARAIIGKL